GPLASAFSASTPSSAKAPLATSPDADADSDLDASGAVEVEDPLRASRHPRRRRPTRVAVVGAGAVGSYYGGRLWEGLREAGSEVSFHLRGEHYDACSERGIEVSSCHGDFAIPAQELRAFRTTEDMVGSAVVDDAGGGEGEGAAFDWVVCALKSTSVSARRPCASFFNVSVPRGRRRERKRATNRQVKVYEIGCKIFRLHRYSNAFYIACEQGESAIYCGSAVGSIQHRVSSDDGGRLCSDDLLESTLGPYSCSRTTSRKNPDAQLDQVPDLLAPLLSPSTRLLVIMNGLVEDDLLEAMRRRNAGEDGPGDVGCKAVYGGMALICSNRLAPGKISHTYGGKLVVGVAYSADADGEDGTWAEYDRTAIEDLFASSADKVPFEFEP
ncbi:hypothetical protein ACHAWF_001198, partial [Thalassiosira exigua]